MAAVDDNSRIIRRATYKTASGTRGSPQVSYPGTLMCKPITFGSNCFMLESKPNLVCLAPIFSFQCYCSSLSRLWTGLGGLRGVAKTSFRPAPSVQHSIFKTSHFRNSEEEKATHMGSLGSEETKYHPFQDISEGKLGRDTLSTHRDVVAPIWNLLSLFHRNIEYFASIACCW